MEKETEPREKIGLFGGTFDPVHLGHLRSAEDIREKFQLSKILFIPAHVPPHKKVPTAAPERRLEMVRIAVGNNPFFDVSDMELQRRGNSYFIETIAYLNRFFDAETELFFIMGLDAFREIHTWKSYPDFFSVCNFIVMSRPGAPEPGGRFMIPRDVAGQFTPGDDADVYIHRSGCSLTFCDITLLDISSTGIRGRVARSESITYLVPEEVARYIAGNGLYKL